jgi:hypothetical protein
MQGNPTVQLRNAECACLPRPRLGPGPVGRDYGFMEVGLKPKTRMVMIFITNYHRIESEKEQKR